MNSEITTISWSLTKGQKSRTQAYSIVLESGRPEKRQLPQIMKILMRGGGGGEECSLPLT